MANKLRGMRSGTVGCDGNGMAGGKWWACDHRATKTISVEEIIDRLEDLLLSLPESFDIDAVIEEGEDTSVGVPHYVEIQELGGIPAQVQAAIDRSPVSNAWKDAICMVFEAYISDLEVDDFDI